MDAVSIALVSAVATALSAGVIAWQAILTRAAVKVSENALVLSERAYRRDLIATIESRSRVPRIEVGSPVREVIAFENTKTSDRSKLTADRVFRFPRDESITIQVRLPFEVANEGDRQMRLHSPSRDLFEGPGIPLSHWLNVEPGTTVQATLVISRTAGELRSTNERRSPMLGPGAFVGTIGFDGPLDADVSLFHHVAIFVPPLVESETLRGNWSLKETPTFLGMISLGGKKVYWESRSEGIKLREDSGIDAERAFEDFHNEHSIDRAEPDELS